MTSKAITTITGPLDVVRRAGYSENEPQFDYDKALRKFNPNMLGHEDIAIFADMDSHGRGRSWEADIGDLCSSDEWLKKYSLRRYRLDLDCILGAVGFRHCSEYDKIVGKPVCSRYADGLFARFTKADGKSYNVIATRDKLHQYESRLVSVMGLYQRRLDWLTSESRRTFGVVCEQNICLILNLCTSNNSLFNHYLAIVRAVLRQQVIHKGRLNIIRSSDIVDSWRPCAVPITKDSIEAAVAWLDTLDSGSFSSATAVAEALLKAGGDKKIDAIYLFTGGDDPVSAHEIMLQQARLIGITINVVAFNVFEEPQLHFLRELAATGRGRFHAYTINWCVEDFDINPALLQAQKPSPQVMNNPVISKRYLYGGVPPGAGIREDVFKIYEEIETAKNNLAIVQTIMRDLPETQMAEKEMERQRALAQRRVQAEQVFTRGTDAEEYMSSREWLQKYGIRARKLDLYDVLAGVAFRHCDGVVDVGAHPGVNAFQTDAIIQQKLVNARYCHKFAHLRWRDGSLVHVQVTGEIHRGFMEQLKVAVDMIQKRIAWLKSGSRELFGSIIENQVYIVLDISSSMAPSIKFVKDKIFQLMQEQLRHKSKFNIVAFNSKVYAWKTRLAPVCEESLRNAWQWVKQLECVGSTNTMAALDYAMGDPETEAVYLLTDGRPDQPGSAVIAQATHRRVLPVHAISFNCHDAEANQFLAELARVTNGRFHAFSSSGDIIIDPVSDEPEPWESEDVKVLKMELVVAREYADTMTQLRKECIALAWNKETHNEAKRLGKGPYRPKIVGAMIGGSSSRPSSSPALTNYAFKPQPDRMVTLVKKSRFKPNIARHTKTSILRLVKEESPGRSHSPVVLGLRPAYLGPASGDDSERSDDSSSDDEKRHRKISARQQKQRAASAGPRTTPRKSKLGPKGRSVTRWLAKHGLAPKRLLAIDVLAPLMFVLHRKVATSVTNSARSNHQFDELTKIMDEVMPGGNSTFDLGDEHVDFNSLAISLQRYESDLVKAIEKFEKHLSRWVWQAIDDRDKRQLNPLKPLEPVPFRRYRAELFPALDRAEWKKISERDVNFMEKEIETAMNCLKQCRNFQMWLNQRQGRSSNSSRQKDGQDVISVALTPRSSASKSRPKSAAVVGSPVSRDDNDDDGGSRSAMYGKLKKEDNEESSGSESDTKESSSDQSDDKK